MRALLATFAFLVGTFLEAEDRNPIDLEKALEGDWSVVRVSHYDFMGDFDHEYPVIFLQLLPDNRLLISHAVQRRWDRLVPKPVRFLEREEWEKVKAQILEHFSIALNSDPESQIRKNSLGSDFHSIDISVTGNKTKQFSNRFSLSDDTSTRFREFLETLTKAP